MILEERTSIYNDETERYSDIDDLCQGNTRRMFVVVPFTEALSFCVDILSTTI